MPEPIFCTRKKEFRLSHGTSDVSTHFNTQWKTHTLFLVPLHSLKCLQKLLPFQCNLLTNLDRFFFKIKKVIFISQWRLRFLLFISVDSWCVEYGIFYLALIKSQQGIFLCKDSMQTLGNQLKHSNTFNLLRISNIFLLLLLLLNY